MKDNNDLYLDLLEKVLLGVIYEDPTMDHWSKGGFDPELRLKGLDWPSQAHTMIGFHRLRNIRDLLETIINEGIPGDLIETGAWRGGACIYMRAVLKVNECKDRTVWVADSFEGLPKPEAEKYPADQGDQHHTYKELAISMESVQSNFDKYGLLDSQVKFLKGWFKDSLPTAPIERLALLRLDGDMYSSTMEAIELLYDKLSVGGFVIVDDYGVVPACKQAITDYRDRHGIIDPIVPIDGVGVYWRKSNTA
jgi:O-methyltransferase/8-demethyl-8-(2,3-dimethoxy-alpha-L-rhamnosyl)tetracenomycin-C 4'-O-methyltransferase